MDAIQIGLMSAFHPPRSLRLQAQGQFDFGNQSGTIAPMLADPMIYLWPLGVSLFVAIVFAWVLIRGMRTGKLSQLRGGQVDRASHPAMFWILAAAYVVSGLVILVIAFGKLWKPFMGH